MNSQCDGDRDGYDAMVLLTGRYDYTDMRPGWAWTEPLETVSPIYYLYILILLYIWLVKSDTKLNNKSDYETIRFDNGRNLLNEKLTPMEENSF